MGPIRPIGIQMSSSSVTPFETILKLCRQAAPEPWYPAEFAASLGIDDGRFRGPLQELAVAGLIEPAKWHAERGQGYRLTREGAAIVDSPGLLEELRVGRGGARDDDDARPPRRASGARASLGNAGRPYVTYALLALNVGMLLLAASIALGGNWGQGGIRWFLIGGDAHARHVTGEASAADIDAGHWWRLIATIFVHRDFFHLLINMSTFFAVSRLAEQLWGGWRLLVIYVISGIAYVCTSLWHDPLTPPLGAAGSIFGMMLSCATWMALNRRSLPIEVVRSGIRQVLGSAAWFLGWLALFAWLGGLEFRWVGYVAGAVAGLVTSVLLNQQRYIASPVRWAFLALVPIVPAVAVGLVVHAKGSKPEWRDAVAVQQKKQEEQRAAAQQQKEKNRTKGERDRFHNDLLPQVEKAAEF